MPKNFYIKNFWGPDTPEIELNSDRAKRSKIFSRTCGTPAHPIGPGAAHKKPRPPETTLIPGVKP